MDRNLTLYAPIEKTDPTQHMVYGYASTEALDSQGEIVKADALKDALADYMKFANIREMHQPKAVGKTKQATLDKKGLYIGVKVIDKDAWEKVSEGVYNGFSIGGHVKTQVDNEITGLALSEISLVDRPANPEAVFDVWKADTTKRDFSSKDRKALATAGKALPDGSFPIVNEADLHNAIRAIGRASNPTEAKAHIIARAKTMGMTDALPDDWVSEKVDIAEVEKKAKKEDNEMELTGKDTPAEDSANTEQDDANEDKEDGSADETNEEDEGDGEVTPAKKKKADDAEDILKIIDAKIKLGQMPTEDEVVAMLKVQELPVTEKTRDLLKYELAGLIVKEVETQMKIAENADFAKREAEKILNAADVQGADTVAERKQFEKIMDLINRTETLMKGGGYLEYPTKTVANPDGEAKQNDYEITDPALPAKNTNAVMGDNGNSATSSDLVSVQALVALLASKNMGGALTLDDIETLKNGTKNPNTSERTSSDQMSQEPTEGNLIPGKQMAENATNLKKIADGFLAKIAVLEAKIEKLEKTPMPIKVKTAFATIEKAHVSTDGDLGKALQRANELQELMKADPQNQTLQQEAKALAPHIMKLQREAKV